MATPFDPSQFGDSHRLFLQSLLASGILNSFQIRENFRHCLRAFDIEVADTSDHMTKFIKACKQEVKELGMDIVLQRDEEDSMLTYYVLCNIQDRVYAEKHEKWMNDFTLKEVELIRELSNVILLSEYKEVRKTDAVNLASEVKTHGKMTPTEAEKSIRKFIKKHWLGETSDKCSLYLGPRFLAEMRPYLEQLRKDATKDGQVDDEHPGSGVSECYGCAKLVIRAVTCPRCETVHHQRCLLRDKTDEVDANSLSAVLARCRNCKKEVVNMPYSPKKKAGKKKSAKKVLESSDEDE